MLSLVYFLGCYLVGGIPFGYLIAKAQGIDIRTVGSGNIGATNVGRSLGKGPGLVVFVLDSMKGALPALLAFSLFKNATDGFSSGDHAVIAGTCAIFGHLFSPFLKFTGGKGVATALGVLLTVAVPVGGIALGCFVIAMAFTQIVSLSSLIALVFMIAAAILLKLPVAYIICFSLIGLGVVYKHSDNIRRILKGEEKKFSFKSSQTKQDKQGGDDAAVR